MITKVNDYIPKLMQMFPDVSEADIKRSVNYGWKMFFYYNLCGCDVVVQDQKAGLWCYCGNLYNDSLQFFNYYKRKLCYKIRLLFRRNHESWDGYYYTAIEHPKKRKQFNCTVTNKFIFKLLDEAKVYYSGEKYFIRFKYPLNLGYKRYREKMKVYNAEMIYTREKPATFKDILISENEYQYL